MIRVGIVGLGVIGTYYRAAVADHPGLRLAAVCDLRPELLDEVGGDACDRYTDHCRMLAEADLDAVVVTVPNDAHHAVCRDAIAAGAAVCVEKPLATTLAHACDLDRRARAAGVPLYTAFHRRHNDNLHALLSTMESTASHVVVRYLERIEEHVGVDAWYLDPVRCGGGCVADNGPNAFDLVRAFLGDVSVTGVTITREAGIDRRAVVALRAPTGATARVELDWSFPGEVKDVRVELADGSVRHADLLAGHPGFKQSLWHEYRGVVAEFAGLVAGGGRAGGGGLAALALVESCYRLEGLERTALMRENGAKRPVAGALVKVLLHRRDERGMTLEPHASRCVREGEVHELVTTDHAETAPGARIDRVGFLGFAELHNAGVIDRGDEVWIGDRLVGTVHGFDACHFPNHYNILIAAPRPVSGGDLALAPELPVTFRPVP